MVGFLCFVDFVIDVTPGACVRRPGVVLSLLLCRDADTVAYATMTTWELAKSPANARLLGHLGAVETLLQWSGALLAHCVDEVCTVRERVADSW